MVPKNGFQSATSFRVDRGISDTTLWRWRKKGWLRTVEILGHCYVDLDSVAEFDKRAVNGEFASGYHGASANAIAKSAAEKERLRGQI